MKSPSPRTLPPPSLPRDLVARTRIQTETEELADVGDPKTLAALYFELGSLHEYGLGDARRAEAHHRRALQQRSRFWPSLLALARLYADLDQPAQAAAVWEALGRSARVPATAALALSRAGLLLYDRAGQKERAAALWNDALAADPSCLEAALLLEQHQRATGEAWPIDRLLTAHAESVSDAPIEAALLVELASAQAQAGQLDAAFARLTRAQTLDPRARHASSELERLARKHDRPEALLSALDALAEREPDAVARLCEAARIAAVRLRDRAGARDRYAKALALAPRDRLARWERAALLAGDDPAEAIADLRALLDDPGDDRLAAAVRVRLAELLARSEDGQPHALRELGLAYRLAPDSAAACAGLEDALVRAHSHVELRDHLLARGADGPAPARAEHILRAGRIALLELTPKDAALDLVRRAALLADRPEHGLWPLYGAAAFAGAVAAAIDAAERLCTNAALHPFERSLLRFDQYHRLRAVDRAAGRRLLANVLPEPELADWAPFAARLEGAAGRDYALLAAAHRALARNAGDDLRAAAHLCGAARALLRGGQPQPAVAAAREALALAPDDAYALSLIEECLLSAGEEREAAQVLRQAAQTHADGKQRELALLHAGAAAEAANDARAAARSYEEAAEIDGGSLAPRWALRRLAERRSDRGLFAHALEALAAHERQASESGLCNLELGELRASHASLPAAVAALRVALDRADTRAPAALELCLLPEPDVERELRESAVAALVRGSRDDERVSFLRDGIASLRLRANAGGKALLDAALAEHGDDAGLAVAALLAAEDDLERAAGLDRLARSLPEDAGAALSLHALRISQLAQGEAAAEDTLLRALDLAERSPEGLAAQVALDEALWAGDDADSRAGALAGRLAHTTAPELAAPLEAARARALLAAGHARAAESALRAALAREPEDLALCELSWSSALGLGEFERAAEAAERMAQTAQGGKRAALLEQAAALREDDPAHAAAAERCYAQAFEAEAGADLAFAWLHDRLVARRELGPLLALIERRMAGQNDPVRWIDLDYERALVLRASGQKAEAIRALEQLLALDPQHVAALGLLTEACTASERWGEAVDALRGLAAAPVPEAQQRLARLGAAEFLENKLSDLRGAAAELEAQRARNPEDDEVLVRLAGIYERSARFRDAVIAYRRAASLRFGSAAAELERQAGGLLRHHLGAVSEAIEAYEHALYENPLDAESCAQLLALVDSEAERARWLGRLGNGLSQALERAPARPELLRLLQRYGALSAQPDLEFIALSALRALAPLEPDEQALLAARPARPEPAGQLEPALLLDLAGEFASAPLTVVGRRVSAALGALERESGSGPSFPDAPAGDALTAARAGDERFALGAQAMARALQLGPIYARTRAGRREALRAGLWLGTGTRGDPAIEALAKRLGKHIGRVARREIAHMAEQPGGGVDDIDRYLDALDACCARAGLLAADDPRPALAGSGPLEDDAPAHEGAARALDLLRFWLSPRLLELRRDRLSRTPEGTAPAVVDPPLAVASTDAELDLALQALQPSFLPSADTEARAGDPSLHPPAFVPVRAEPESGPPSALLLLDDDAGPDPGAETAYRSLPRRLTPELRARFAAPPQPAPRERAELLEHLAGLCEGKRRGRLLAAAAETFLQAGESQHARTLYEQAYADDAGDPLVLRELRKYALAERNAARAAELLEREAALPLAPEERAFAWLLRAELELIVRGDPAAAERAALQALACHESVEAALLLFHARTRGGAARDRDAAEALRRAASSLRDGAVKSALLCEAGRLMLRGGEAVAAAVLCEQAHSAFPSALDAALCWVRAARAAGDTRAALLALEQLEKGLLGPELRDHALRARARLHEASGDASSALRLLGGARSLASSRLRARLAEQLAQPSDRRAALEHWAEVTSGEQRALALLGLCEHLLSQGEGSAARSALERAATADGGSSLVQLAQARLARVTGDASLLARSAAHAAAGERLQAAARLAAEARNTPDELALVEPAAAESPTAAALALDAAAELADAPALAHALAREAEQHSGAVREGIELVAIELGGGPAAADRAPRTALQRLQRVYTAAGPTDLGARWLELAVETHGAFAACAATVAGDYLRDAGRAREAYDRALSALPGYAPACWSLEALLTPQGDRAALERVHGALARATRDPVERASRLLRAARLADAEQNEIARASQELSALSEVDALLCDRELRSDDDRAQLLLAEALEAGGHSRGGAIADLCALRAAARYEDAGEHARAAVLYREVLDRSEGPSPHAELGLPRSLAMAGLHALLVERLEHAVARAQAPLEKRIALERLARFETTAGDERRAARSLRALLELAPHDVGTLLAIQREAMRDGDAHELARSARGLAEATTDPRERAAQLTLLARAHAALGQPVGQAPRTERSGDPTLYEALEQERLARARGDVAGAAEAVLALCAHLRDDGERASYALRAAELLESISPKRAALALFPYGQAAERHPFVHEALARLFQAAGDPARAAESFERAAQASPAPARSVRLFHRAACLFQDTLGDRERARHALEALVAIDPLYRDAFSRLRELYVANGDHEALCALYATRIEAGGSPTQLADFHAERARTLLRLGRDEEAKAALTAALAIEPERVGTLRELSELYLSAGQHRLAADTLIKLARVATDEAVLRKTFFELGAIYSEALPDPRRAEIAYARAARLDPNDRVPVERLLALYLRDQNHEKAMRACERLIDLASDDAEVDRFTIQLASILETKGDPLRAERVLNARRSQTPTAPAILTALCELYTRQGDQPALKVHVDRSLHALRAVIERDPNDGPRFAAFSDMLARRGRPHAAAAVAAIAEDLGLADGPLLARSAQHLALGSRALQPVLFARVAPPELTDSVRALARFLDARGGELFGIDTERLANPTPALAAALDYTRSAFGLRELSLLGSPGRACVPLRADPLVLGVGRDLIAHCDGDQLAFLLMRAACAARAGMVGVLRCNVRELGLLLAVMREPDEVAALKGKNSPAQAMRDRAVALGARRFAELEALVANAPLSAAELQAVAFEQGARVALAYGAAYGPAFAALAASAGPLPPAEYGQPLAGLARAEQARAALRFVLSDIYLDLHAPPPPESKQAHG